MDEPNNWMLKICECIKATDAVISEVEGAGVSRDHGETRFYRTDKAQDRGCLGLHCGVNEVETVLVNQ